VRQLRLVVLHHADAANATLSYQHGWPAGLARDRRFEVTALNLARRGAVATVAMRRRQLDRADAIVMLHSVFSNTCAIPPRLADLIGHARPPKVFFIGNEYKLMPEKMAFAERTRTTLLVSQLLSAEALDLYRRRLGCAVVGIPNTGFDPSVFRPTSGWEERPIDIGYRAFASPLYLGHDERRELADAGAAAARRRGLVADISLDPAARFDMRGWADFLNRCRGQLGTEAGGDWLELTDATRVAVNDFLASNPDADIHEVRARFFADRQSSSIGRTISGRVVEAAATKTVQILLQGEYGGFFEPDVHYIPVQKDLSDLDGALSRLDDTAECKAIADRAYEVAYAELTYTRLLDRFVDALALVV
jgi:Glycosyl transferases group 1